MYATILRIELYLGEEGSSTKEAGTFACTEPFHPIRQNLLPSDGCKSLKPMFQGLMFRNIGNLIKCPLLRLYSSSLKIS